MSEEIDEDLEIAEMAEEEELEIPETDSRKIVWQAKDFSIREFHSMRGDGDLVLQPEYQRKYVMSPILASRLVESILMDVPIPVVYLAEEMSGQYSVIDGQQRLTSFLSFLDGKLPDGKVFKLTGLKVFKELNRLGFDQLEKEQQTKLRTATIHTITIKKESHEDIKFEIFERLNTGSVKLNEDEIRNTVYRGNYIKLLSELEENEVFDGLIAKSNFKKRMIYRGMILRFLALSEKTYMNYRPSMKQFCNKELRDNQNLTAEKEKEYRIRFNHCVDLVKVVFGNHAFRRYDVGRNGQPGSWTVSRINMALYDIQMCGFVNRTKNEVLSKADDIREAMLQLMSDEDFLQSIMYKTSDRSIMPIRFKTWFERLDKILGDQSYQQRLFPLSIKKSLFESNPVCAISGQQILAIEDAEVDHIVPFSKGGLTELPNAQLVLRYFNRAKKDKEAAL